MYALSSMKGLTPSWGGAGRRGYNVLEIDTTCNNQQNVSRVFVSCPVLFAFNV